MKRSSFFPSFALYGSTLILCGGIRIWLKLARMDQTTGFYIGSPFLPTIFYGLVGLCVVALFVLYLLRRGSGDYPVLRSRKHIAPVACLTGVAILLYTMELAGFSPFGSEPPVVLGRFVVIICALLGLGASVTLLRSGIRGLRYGRMSGGLSMLLPGVWMLVLLVCRFNTYYTLTTISDNLLTVLFMVFASLFLVGQARTLTGLSRKDGRNYVIPAGLCTSLFGFLVALPNWVWMAVNHSPNIPSPMLGLLESVFLFVLALYALLFVYHTCASIYEV